MTNGDQQHAFPGTNSSYADQSRGQSNKHSSQDQVVDSSTNNLPPITYMSYMVANQLLPKGAAMFNRRSDANCVLYVGQRRFYVHVQMLASRSPTFRLIFDEMIANGAWGSVNEALYLPDEDGDLGFSEPKEMCISTGESSDGQERDEDQGLGYNSYTQEADVYVDECKDENEGDHQHVNGILYSHGNIEAVWRSKLETDLNQSAHSHVAPELSERYDVDGSLPKLTLDLEGPDDGHVDELLYWLYTDNAPRWLASFTTSNYENILRNILLLNIVTPQVLQVCRDFEASIDPGSGLRGRMDQVLCQVPMTGCPETRE